MVCVERTHLQAGIVQLLLKCCDRALGLGNDPIARSPHDKIDLIGFLEFGLEPQLPVVGTLDVNADAERRTPFAGCRFPLKSNFHRLFVGHGQLHGDRHLPRALCLQCTELGRIKVSQGAFDVLQLGAMFSSALAQSG